MSTEEPSNQVLYGLACPAARTLIPLVSSRPVARPTHKAGREGVDRLPSENRSGEIAINWAFEKSFRDAAIGPFMVATAILLAASSIAAANDSPTDVTILA